MQINGIVLLVVIGAVAVLAKKGSSEEKNVVPLVIYPNVENQPMVVEVVGKGKRKPNRYPQGRPFQVQSAMDGRYPQMTAFYPQQAGMQQPSFGMQGGQRPFGQNSFSGFPSSMTQQRPGNFNNPTLGYSGSSRPFYAGSKPNQFQGSSQFPGASQFPGSTQFPESSQFPGSSQFPVSSQFPGSSQFPVSSQFPGSSQFPDSFQLSGNSKFPGSAQGSFSSQFPGSSFPLSS